LTVGEVAQLVLTYLSEKYPQLAFRYRNGIKKSEIHEKLSSIDAELGQSIFVTGASIRPDGGLIEVQDQGILLNAPNTPDQEDISLLEKSTLWKNIVVFPQYATTNGAEVLRKTLCSPLNFLDSREQNEQNHRENPLSIVADALLWWLNLSCQSQVTHVLLKLW
jgi:hypothetical protein